MPDLEPDLFDVNQSRESGRRACCSYGWPGWFRPR